MPELLFAKQIEKPLTKTAIKKLKEDYRVALSQKHPFPHFKGTAYPSLLQVLKRDSFTIGPYINITIFEAANRIASDLTLLEGVLQLFKNKSITGSAIVKLRLGTMQEKGKGDFSVFDSGNELQGEAFDVAPSFFKIKLYKTLKKWNDDKTFKYVVFNSDCLDDSSCKTYYKNQKSERSEIVFLGVSSWQK